MNDSRPPLLVLAMQTLVDFDKPTCWLEFAAPTVNGRCCNIFRHLKRRGFVRNTVDGYKLGEKYTGPRPQLYVPTEDGLAFLHQGSQ